MLAELRSRQAHGGGQVLSTPAMRYWHCAHSAVCQDNMHGPTKLYDYCMTRRQGTEETRPVQSCKAFVVCLLACLIFFFSPDLGWPSLC